MTQRVSAAIEASLHGEAAFCKFLAANDVGLTRSHQSGIYVNKSAFQILFDKPGMRGKNKERQVEIQWEDGRVTKSMFKYYGVSTRDEYRITRFGRGFPYLQPVYTGALFILVKESESNYKAFVLNTEEEIQDYLTNFDLSPVDANTIIVRGLSFPSPDEQLDCAIAEFIKNLGPSGFPATDQMARGARLIEEQVYGRPNLILTNPDEKLISWINIEYRLFHAIEISRYESLIKNGFSSVDELIKIANQILNRRKSRAGKSLEHHLSAIFDKNQLKYTPQALTEGKIRLDFIFPSETAYHDNAFPVDQLVSLAAKTTCKDRWRQVINEAKRLKNETKHLFTLQQGISPFQLDEMAHNKVQLVVPKPYIQTFPTDYRDKIMSLKEFIQYVKRKQK